jgi:hypothetical protein
MTDSERVIHDESPKPYEVGSEEFAHVREDTRALPRDWTAPRLIATIDLLIAERDGARAEARELRDKERKKLMKEILTDVS